MHGPERSKEELKKLSPLLQKAQAQGAAQYDFTITPEMYAVFYSEPLPVSMYEVQIFIYSDGTTVGSFTILEAYPLLAEVENNTNAPEPCNLIAGIKAKTDNGNDYTWAQTINVTDSGNGVIISVPTGEVNDQGVAIAYSTYMEIVKHP